MASYVGLERLPKRSTRRLILRRLAKCDAPALLEITDVPDIIATVPFWDRSPGLLEIEALIQRNETPQECFIGAWRKLDERLVAVVGCHLRESGQIEIGYWAGRDYRGQGFTREAVAAVLSMLRVAAPNQTIIAECRPDNHASWHILESVGFRHGGEAGTRSGRKHLTFRESPLAD